MKRFERRRVERLRRRVLTIGLSFCVGALVDAAFTWRLHEFDVNRADAAVASSPHESSAPAGSASSAGSTRTESAPAPVATTGLVPRGAEIDLLKRRDLDIPVDGVQPSALRDTFGESRAFGRAHEAIDIMAPKGTPVRAVEDGKIAKLFTSVAGGLTIYQFDPGETFAYYYAHLDSYAHDVREGEPVRRGQVIGYVGTTGNAPENAPHLHFAIFRLTDEHKWWKGDPVNPYPVLK